jgi:hypothetical protein
MLICRNFVPFSTEIGTQKKRLCQCHLCQNVTCHRSVTFVTFWTLHFKSPENPYLSGHSKPPTPKAPISKCYTSRCIRCVLHFGHVRYVLSMSVLSDSTPPHVVQDRLPRGSQRTLVGLAPVGHLTRDARRVRN